MGLRENTGLAANTGPWTVEGLSHEEAEERFLRYGPNLLMEKKMISPVRLLFSQFTDIMVIILMISTAISAFMGELTKPSL